MPSNLGALAVLGLRPDAEELYRELLRAPRTGTPPLPQGWNEERLLTAVAELVDAGLVACEPAPGNPAPGNPAPAALVRLPVPGSLSVRVVEPAVAVRALLTRTEREIEDSRQRLAVARAAVEQMEADYLRTRAEDLGTPQIEIVDAALAPSVLLPLVRGSSGPVHTLHRCRPEHGAADRAVFEALAEAAEAGRVLRGVYPLEVLEDPRWAAWARRRAAIGERQRLTARPLPDVTIVGREAVVVGPTGSHPGTPGEGDTPREGDLPRKGDSPRKGDPARGGDTPREGGTPAQEGGGTVLVSRAPQLVDAFGEVFDGWWQASAPVPDEEEIGERERLLGFLAAGCKDETVARLLGLSVRTVRRRVAEFMAEYEVSTRLQLGVEAVRRGLL